MYPVIIPNPVPIPSAPNNPSTGNRGLYRDKRQLQFINTQPHSSIASTHLPSPQTTTSTNASCYVGTLPHQSHQGTASNSTTNTINNNNATHGTAKHPTESLPLTSAKPAMFKGLTLFLPMKSAMKMKADNCSLMAMFESCTRSRKFLKIASTLTADKKEWLSLLHIDDLFICSGRAKRLRQSKVDAATQALTMLQKFQPIIYKPVEQMFLRNDEVIAGFTLYLVSSNPGGAECLQSLTESCVHCALELTLWHDKGEVFGAAHATVLLINAKPICLATGKDLDGAKRAAAREAVSVLKVNHPVVRVFKRTDHEPTSKPYDLLTSSDTTTIPILSSQAGQSATKQSPLHPSTTSSLIKVQLPTEQTKSQLNQPEPDVITLEPNQPQSATCEAKPYQRQSTITQKMNFRKNSSASLYVTEKFVPELTLLLPKDGHDKNAYETLRRSASYSGLHLRFNNIGWVEKDSESVVATALLIGDYVVAWGFGDSAKTSRHNISWSSTLDTLMRSAPVKYFHGKNSLKRMSSQIKTKESDSYIKRKYEDSKELVMNIIQRTDNDSRTDSESDGEEQSITEDNEKPEKLFVVCSEWIGGEPGDEEAMRDCDEIIQMHIEELL